MNEIKKDFGWDVEEHPVYSNNKLSPKFKSIRRSDNDFELNICKQSYYPTTNERMMEVVDYLQGISGFEFTGVSEFNNGGNVLAYLKNDNPKKVNGFDMKDYLVIGNSHNYHTGFFIGSSKIMIRCMNAFTQINRQFKISHTKSSDLKIDRLAMQFSKYLEMEEDLCKTFERWAEIPIDNKLREAMIARIVDIEMGKEERLSNVKISTQKKNTIDLLVKSIDRETVDLGNNLFGLFNGVTHFTTHVKNAREKVEGNVLGSMALLNDKAYGFCQLAEMDYQ